jgi:hypothetical protein
VHELLNRLARAGLDGIPDVLGEDEQGREVLTFLEGETVDVDADQAPDQVLAEAAHWLRRTGHAGGAPAAHSPSRRPPTR